MLTRRYGTTINGPAEQPRGKYNYSFTVGTFKNVTTAASRGLGPVYATGISGSWVWCENTSVPTTCVFDDTARATIDWMKDELGSNHMAHWVDEGTSQATWDAWGYFLHRDRERDPPLIRATTRTLKSDDAESVAGGMLPARC